MATTKVSQMDVQNSLAGVTYPANKQDLIKAAKKKSASSDVISTLNGIPDREYIDSADLSSELGVDAEE